MEFDDSGAPQKIQEFVRDNEHIEVYDYIRRGAVGEVYFGKRKKLDDHIVLKFYWSQPGYDASEEAVVLRSIKHPNILEVYDLRFLQPTFAYFITPRIEGGDLQNLIDIGPVSTDLALTLLSDILKGVNELHSKHRFVHRDLKPGNILFDSHKRIAIVADLGAVKKVSDKDSSTNASKATRMYMPPESVESDKWYFQSDLYQVGLIMFQLLGGKFPISNPIEWLSLREQTILSKIRNGIERENKLFELLDKKIVAGTIADLSTLPTYLDPKFKRIVKKALSADPHKRHKSAAEFFQDIHSLVITLPTYFKAPDGLYITHKDGKQYRITEGKAGGVIVEKKLLGKTWRKDNDHDGTFSSALSYCTK